ncbi:MAG TPA: DoxX family membrane protein [Myxococcaceae bacterium]|nr:DoxX family membrane protein [Myxococcaceae bacterium]
MDEHAAETIGATREQRALAVLRVALGAMFVWVFFENLGKGAYSPAGYKGVIDYYLKNGHAPDIWKGVMSAAAANARFAGPLQALTELGFGVLLVAGGATRVVAAAAGLFLFSLWVSELGTSWVWELAMPVIVAFTLAWARAGRAWGLDGLLARRFPNWRRIG